MDEDNDLIDGNIHNGISSLTGLTETYIKDLVILKGDREHNIFFPWLGIYFTWPLWIWSNKW